MGEERDAILDWMKCLISDFLDEKLGEDGAKCVIFISCPGFIMVRGV